MDEKSSLMSEAVMLYTVDLNHYHQLNELQNTFTGLGGFKVNINQAKQILAEIGPELSLAKHFSSLLVSSSRWLTTFPLI